MSVGASMSLKLYSTLVVLRENVRAVRNVWDMEGIYAVAIRMSQVVQTLNLDNPTTVKRGDAEFEKTLRAN